jgi:cytochrome P450
VGCDLGDGTHVPSGYRVAIDMKAIHFNPLVYPDPNRCDLFRFSKMRTNIGSEAQCGFTTVDDNVRSWFFSRYVSHGTDSINPFLQYLPFGAGMYDVH